jgi:hypothetical protein
MSSNGRIIHELVIRNDLTSPNLRQTLLLRNFSGATEESHENPVRIADLGPIFETWVIPREYEKRDYTLVRGFRPK